MHVYEKEKQDNPILYNIQPMNTTSRFLRLVMEVLYKAVPLWWLQVIVPLRVLWGYSDTTVTQGWEAAAYAIVAEYPLSTLKDTPTFSSYRGYWITWDPFSWLRGIWMCSVCCVYTSIFGRKTQLQMLSTGDHWLTKHRRLGYRAKRQSYCIAFS